jgi:hypothetical protein
MKCSTPKANVGELNVFRNQCHQSIIGYLWRLIQEAKGRGRSPVDLHWMFWHLKKQDELEQQAVFEKQGVKVGHHGYLGALQQSAEAGCQLCSRLAADVDAPSAAEYDLAILSRSSLPGLELRLRDRPERSFQFQLRDGDPMVSLNTTLRYSRTNAPAIFDLAKSWIHCCQATHTGCRERREQQGHQSTSPDSLFTPTRLVHVQGAGNELSLVQLTATAELDGQPQYLTLSHCWGGADIIRLTQHTHASYKIAIPKDQLPTTFQDALLITIKLGYEYIWIDSLCIIQDSKEDWSREAAVMGDIYWNSTCTIAAVAARDSHEGCFHERNALSFLPCQLVPESEGVAGIYVQSGRNHREPLHSRAWVLQERCLSTRTLSYSSNQISWDCIDGFASESSPEIWSSAWVPSLKRRFNRILPLVQQGHPERQRDWREDWSALVKEYSARDITFVEDRWEAIQGLARVIQSRGEQYMIDGLWNVGLGEELLWAVVSKTWPTRLDIGAASWSWLSVAGEIQKLNYQRKDMYVIDATVNLHHTPQTKDLSRATGNDWVRSPQVLESSALCFRIRTIFSRYNPRGHGDRNYPYIYSRMIPRNLPT